jgi:hypothetical protein
MKIGYPFEIFKDFILAIGFVLIFIPIFIFKSVKFLGE